jgi:hypothetical protein
LKGECVKGLITYPVQDASVAQYPSNARALTSAGQAVSALPPRGAVAVQLAEFAVLLLRGSATAILLSPAVLLAVMLVR